MCACDMRGLSRSEQRNAFDMSWIEDGLMEQTLVSSTAARVTPLVNTPGRYVPPAVQWSGPAASTTKAATTGATRRAGREGRSWLGSRTHSLRRFSGTMPVGSDWC
jgi:hypothetical protein